MASSEYYRRNFQQGISLYLYFVLRGVQCNLGASHLLSRPSSIPSSREKTTMRLPALSQVRSFRLGYDHLALSSSNIHRCRLVANTRYYVISQGIGEVKQKGIDVQPPHYIFLPTQISCSHSITATPRVIQSPSPDNPPAAASQSHHIALCFRFPQQHHRPRILYFSLPHHLRMQ